MNANQSASAPIPRLIALIVAGAMFMAQLDSTVVMLALPQMAASFGIQPVDLSIGVTIYILVQAVFLPSASWVADRFGARRVFAAALIGFTVASILCALSESLVEFVAARVLQGMAAAWMTPVGRIVMLQATPKENLVNVITITTIPMLLAPTLGPPLGGFVTTFLSWHWIFLLNVPFGLAGVLLVLRYIPASSEAQRRPFDVFGFLTFGAAVSAVLYGMDRVSAGGGTGSIPAALIVAGLACGFVAVRHLARHPHPVISLASLRIPTYSIATIGGGAFARLPLRALPFILPLFFQIVFELSAFETGLLLLALNGADLVLKPLVGRTLKRFGFRTVMLATGVLSALSVAACAAFAPDSPMWVICAVLLASGMFRSILFSALGSIAFADVPKDQIGSASVLWNVVIQVTNALAVSCSVILLNLSTVLGGEKDVPTLVDFQVTLLALAALGLGAAFTFRRLPPDAAAHVSGHRSAGSGA
ncbi:MAG: MFS transporter [Proteobacteria bacterium]|nr:MAG: MFS transporter [Pseudomonadota bacterium]